MSEQIGWLLLMASLCLSVKRPILIVSVLPMEFSSDLWGWHTFLYWKFSFRWTFLRIKPKFLVWIWIFVLGFLLCSRVESGAGMTVTSTSFALERFLPEFLSLFQFRFDHLLKLTSLLLSMTVRPTNILTARRDMDEQIHTGYWLCYHHLDSGVCLIVWFVFRFIDYIYKDKQCDY